MAEPFRPGRVPDPADSADWKAYAMTLRDYLQQTVSELERLSSKADPALARKYTATNVTEDRTYDADATTVAELADVLGTLLADLSQRGDARSKGGA